MYYSFGAHPAFNCQIGDYLEFQNEEKLLTERIDHESILIEEKFPVEIKDKRFYDMVPECNDFSKTAMIIFPNLPLFAYNNDITL